MICGDKCLGWYKNTKKSGTCHCGNDGSFVHKDGYHCCTPKNVTCTPEGQNVKCPEGKKLPFNTFCQYQGQCPITASGDTVLGTTLVTANCNYEENQHCISDGYSIKVCVNGTDKQIDGGRVCDQSLGVLDYLQGYTRLFKHSMICFSRMDSNKNIFERRPSEKIRKKKRWNFYGEIEMRNGKLICQNANYSIDDVCYKRDEKLYNFWKGVKHGPGTIPEYYESNLGPRQKCNFKNGESYEINFQ